MGLIAGQFIADKQEIIYSSASPDPIGKNISDLKKYVQFPEHAPPEIMRLLETKINRAVR